MGIELIQVRTGPSIGKPTYRGVQHLGGTREAIQSELREVIARMRNDDDDDDDSGRAIRARVEAMQKKFLESSESGRALQAMMRFAEWM